MSTDTKELYATRKASNDDEDFMQRHRLQFADSLKDLKNLRKQLYSAADRFESSYNKTDHNQIVIQLSKDYIAKALVSTVDHLGSVADKLNKSLNERASEFCSANAQLAFIEQRLSVFQEFIGSDAFSRQSLMMENVGHQKHYALQDKDSLKVCEVSEDKSFSEEFQGARKKPLLRKQQSKMMPSREQSPNPLSFSFTKVVPNKEADKTGRRSISPFRLILRNRSASDTKRSVSPNLISRPRWPSEPRRAVSECRRQQETKNRDKKEIETYTTSASKQLFKALISVHRLGKEISHESIVE
ncbi:Protein ABIL2 [Striga hermonthica]|uniref:Protein ABIL2 n=1 Tax=Striga hermonthica TaxID=68872 RepID=A0A9N7N9B5_STRHE|nr:Protein ABIL2 [Striga hermonthica]